MKSERNKKEQQQIGKRKDKETSLMSSVIKHCLIFQMLTLEPYELSGIQRHEMWDITQPVLFVSQVKPFFGFHFQHRYDLSLSLSHNYLYCTFLSYKLININWLHFHHKSICVFYQNYHCMSSKRNERSMDNVALIKRKLNNYDDGLEWGVKAIANGENDEFDIPFEYITSNTL